MNDRNALLYNLLLFGRLLRRSGVRVTTGQVALLADALTLVDVQRREDVYNAARCILINGHNDVASFDRVFAAFWRVWTRQEPSTPVVQDSPLPLRFRRKEQEPHSAAMRGNDGLIQDDPAEGHLVEDAFDQEPENSVRAVSVWSAGEHLRGKDFALFDETDLAQARELMALMHWEWTLRPTRRMRPAHRGRHPDIRRTLRKSLRLGGEMVELAWRSRTEKRRPLVVLCDVSGSMDRYSRMLLHFLHVVRRNVEQAEVFVFGTRLTRITSELRTRDPDAAVSAVASQVHDWSGGTRIGEILGTFNRHWARRVLDRGAVVLLISDGWDRGDPDALKAQMARLQRSSYRTIWLNPLLGSPDYEPMTRGLQAALPFVDDFLPAHNLESLEALGRLLADLPKARPPRGGSPRALSSTRPEQDVPRSASSSVVQT